MFCNSYLYQFHSKYYIFVTKLSRIIATCFSSVKFLLSKMGVRSILTVFFVKKESNS